MTAKSLNSLLNRADGQDLARLADKAREMVGLADRLAHSLPAPLQSEIRGANLREDGQLVIIAASSAAAARLRFEEESLLKAARDDGRTVESVVVRVARQA